MKKWTLCACLLLALTACASMPVASMPVAPTPVQTTPTPALSAAVPAPSQTGDPEYPELRYRTETVYDEETKMERTTLDSQGLNLSVYYERPVFEESIPGYEKINAFLETLRDEFFTPDNENLTFSWECALEPIGDAAYHYEITTEVMTQSDKLVSLSPCYYWIMGGVQDYGSDSYTFRIDTGERLRLTDLLEGTEDELKAMIIKALEEQVDVRERDGEPDRVAEYALNEFEFFVFEDRVWVHFDKYEIAHGAAGQFYVLLPASLRAEWMS